MKCLKCGAYVYNSDKFCRNCGTGLTTDTCKYGDNISNSKYDSTSCHGKQYNYSNTYSHINKDSNTTYTNTYDSRYTIDNSKFDYAIFNDTGEDDKYVKAYVGKNFETIKRINFSIPALIFGPLYLFYRKVWGYAIATIIVNLAATFLLSSKLSCFINIIINVFFAFKFKNIYMTQAEEKVESIKQQNLDKTTNELLNLCKKKGGVAPLATLAPFVILVIFLLLLYVVAHII